LVVQGEHVGSAAPSARCVTNAVVSRVSVSLTRRLP
jgi:hypothetical protein